MMRAIGVGCCLAAAAIGCKPTSEGPAAGGGGEKVFVLLNNENSDWWDAVAAGLDEASKEFGVRAELDPNDGTAAGQIEKLRGYNQRTDVAGVAISVIDSQNVAVVDQLKALGEKGIPVVCVDSDVDRSAYRDVRFGYIGTNNTSAGGVLGTAAKTLQADAKYVCFVGQASAQNARDRVGGVSAAVGIEPVDVMQDEGDRQRARQNVRDALTNHPDVNMLVGIWSYNAPAIADVARERNERDRVQICVFDADANAVQAAGEGAIDVMVIQNPFEMGYQSVRLLKALVEDDQTTVEAMYPNRGTADGDVYDTGLKVVVPDGDDRLSSDLFGDNVDFMPLSDFKAWLDKYSLKSS